ncbi:Plant self-incompatibility S1 [Corchorus capsularis]|uniref:Plant self-incompatibility S1 n=1 Tax=Corchorus capsularis TaxID=210143 RepID=A0A1R3I427_COCAP|nr:Plant self-incompatibility S1 [Corchorus capsularis]
MASFVETFFPRVTVTIQNEAGHKVYLKCGFEDSKQELERLEPGDKRSWSFREILFPLRWCYVHINNDNRGAFWAFNVQLQCTDCVWKITDDGAYRFNVENKWVKSQLFQG